MKNHRDFRSISRFISKTIQDRAIVTVLFLLYTTYHFYGE